MYRSSNRELWLAFLAMLLLTALYASFTVFTQHIPAASEFVGHSLGIVGFLLMLMTETLYSLRKRSRVARWGRMSTWLEFHIFTGLVGPFMVFLHTSWKFNGLAGVVTLMMIIVVVSGFIGRYIYTAVPRTVDGAEVASSTLAHEINRTQTEIDTWLSQQSEGVRRFAGQLQNRDTLGGSFVLERGFKNLSERFHWWQATRHMAPEMRQQVRKLQAMEMERRKLRGQLSSLAAARKMLGIWHTVHIPIGMALFTAAFIHISGAIYYATLLR